MPSERKVLIVAEKPSAARAIAEALGGFSSRQGYMESQDYLLSWAIGHLVELKSPEDYDASLKRWNFNTLPVIPRAFGLKVSPKTRSQFELLVRLARQARALVNACDAGREGELIFRYICQAGGIDLPVKRLWVSALTRDAIRKGFAGLRPGEEFERLYQSALCRAKGDWLVGMNGTRAFTVKWGELLSVGRVQTPTLAMLVRRERDIESFVPERYWEVFADFATPDGRQYRGKWFLEDRDRLGGAEEAEAVVRRVQGRPGTVESAEEKLVSERPPMLHDLTQLQRDANRRFGMTAAATLKTAQSLYEKKLITYPRTDSRHLARALLPGLPAVVRALGGLPGLKAAAAGADLALVHPGNRRVVDDTKVTDHHAMIPTAESAAGLAGTEAKIFGLIARRFLAQFYPEARFLETEIITAVSHAETADRFRTRGRRLVEAGWRAVEQDPPRAKETGPDEEEAQDLPGLREGEPVIVSHVESLQKETQPPRRFTEASLLSAMEFAGKEMDDEALKEAMKGRGLGTPATRAAIIERLKDVGYVALQRKSLVPTDKGRQLVHLAETAGASVLLSPELTGEWEKRIADIQAGSFDPLRFMEQVRELAAQVVGWAGAIKGAGPGVRGGGPTSGTDELPAYAGKCPRCGRAVTRGSKEWSCANAECGLRVPTYLCGKVIGAELASALLEKGRTPLVTGFKSPRTGKTFHAFLVLGDGKVGFEFPPDKPRKASGYRRSGGAAGERTEAAKAGPRKTGSRTAARSGGGRAAGTGVGGRAPGAPKPSRTKP